MASAVKQDIPAGFELEPRSTVPPGFLLEHLGDPRQMIPPPEPEEPIEPSDVERVTHHTPNPPTAAIPTKPETPETLAIQMQQLTQGLRSTVMFPKGTMTPTIWPAGVSLTSDAYGNTYAFQPGLVKRSAIHTAARNNTLPQILGSAQNGMGTEDKSQLSGPTMVAVSRAPDGTEVQANAADPTHMPSALKSAASLTPPGGSFSLEMPRDTVRYRSPQPITPLNVSDDLSGPSDF